MLSTEERQALREKVQAGIAVAKEAAERTRELPTADDLQQIREEALPAIHEATLALSALAVDAVERDAERELR